MKILQVIQRYPPSVGGSQRHVQRISEELVKRGHEVTVVTTSSANITDVRGISTAGLTYKNRLMDVPGESDENGVHVLRFGPSFQMLSYLVTPRLFRYLRWNAKDFDIVHAHCYMYAEPDAVMLALRGSETPFILTAHDVFTTQGGLIKAMKGVYDRTLGRMTLRHAKRLIALNEENKRQHLLLGCDQSTIVTVPNGIDFKTYYHLKRDKELHDMLGKPKHVILCISRILEYKGLQHILDAAPAILKQYPDTLFVFVGEDLGYGAELKKRALDADVINHCLFTGSISDEKLIKYYGIADVFVLPSIGEGFGLVALEAMSADVPCVLADHGGLKHVLENIGGFGLDMDGDIAGQITGHVISLLKKRPSLEREQRLIRDEYSWSAVAAKLESVYGQALEKV